MAKEYLGMTVNERLYVSGLMDKYREAIKEKDINKAALILEYVELGRENIKAVLSSDGLKIEDS